VKLGKIKENAQLVERCIKKAADNGSSLILFSECCLTGFFIESRQEAESLSLSSDNKYFKRFASLCDKLDVYVLIGFIEKEGDKLYNSAVLLGPDGFKAVQHKVHKSFIGIDRFVEKGDLPFAVYELPFGKIGFYIDYDHNFPESARVLALDGAELICVPANWSEMSKPIALALSKVRAFENDVFVACADRVGLERGNRYVGLTHIVDHFGNCMAQAGEFDEDIIYADLDLYLADDKKIIFDIDESVDVFGDRRPEFYHRIVD
jgi:5-aminopentanamidase